MEPIIEKMDVYRCPECGQLFLKKEYYDRHARGCGKASTLIGRCVKWSERIDAYTAEYRGRVVDIYYPEPDIDPYTLEDYTEPVTVTVVGFRIDGKRVEMEEYDLEPEELEVVPDEEFEGRYMEMAMAEVRKALEELREEAAENMPPHQGNVCHPEE